MLVAVVLSLRFVVDAAPLIRAHDSWGDVTTISPRRGSKQAGKRRVSLDPGGHAALSELIPVVSPQAVGSMATEVNVFIKANSGRQLSRGSTGTPLTNDDGTPDIADSPLIWTDSKGYAAQWTLSGSSDGSGVFIKCASDRYLIDNDGKVQISEQHNGPWKIQAASQGRVTLQSAGGNLLKEDDTADKPVVLVGADEGDVTMFTVLLKDVDWPPAPITSPLDAERDESIVAGQNEVDGVQGDLSSIEGESSKITFFIIGKENGGHLKENDNNSLDLEGNWLEPSTWTMITAGDANVFIASKRGYYLRDNDGTLQLDTMDENVENKKWMLNYEGDGKVSLQSAAQKYIEDDEEILKMSVLSNDTRPGPTEKALFTLQIQSLSLTS